MRTGIFNHAKLCHLSRYTLWRVHDGPIHSPRLLHSFEGCEAKGDGGAIRVDSGRLRLEHVLFRACRSRAGGGGAIASSGLAVIAAHNCSYAFCAADGVEGIGGAIVARGDATDPNAVVNLDWEVDVKDAGGVVSEVVVVASSFSGCRAAVAGGAIASAGGARTEARGCQFINNTATGLGGGAIYAAGATVRLAGLDCTGNRAPAGGGGVLLWDPPEVSLLAGKNKT